MLRVRIFGNAPYSPGSGLVPRVKILPFVNVQLQADITVGNTATTLGALTGTNRNAVIRFRNISTAGQQIRIGNVGVSIGSGIGTLLYPGEEWTLYNYDQTNGSVIVSHAVADAAAATLNILSLATLL